MQLHDTDIIDKDEKMWGMPRAPCWKYCTSCYWLAQSQRRVLQCSLNRWHLDLIICFWSNCQLGLRFLFSDDFPYGQRHTCVGVTVQKFTVEGSARLCQWRAVVENREISRVRFPFGFLVLDCERGWMSDARGQSVQPGSLPCQQDILYSNALWAGWSQPI